MCCGQNFACSSHYCACCGKIWHLRRQKFPCLKVVLLFLGFSMVKIHFLQKILKKWSSFRKKIKKISITGGGGGSEPYMEFSIIFFLFFNPSLRVAVSSMKITLLKLIVYTVVYAICEFIDWLIEKVKVPCDPVDRPWTRWTLRINFFSSEQINVVLQC